VRACVRVMIFNNLKYCHIAFVFDLYLAAPVSGKYDSVFLPFLPFCCQFCSDQLTTLSLNVGYSLSSDGTGWAYRRLTSLAALLAATPRYQRNMADYLYN